MTKTGCSERVSVREKLKDSVAVMDPMVRVHETVSESAATLSVTVFERLPAALVERVALCDAVALGLVVISSVREVVCVAIDTDLEADAVCEADIDSD